MLSPLTVTPWSMWAVVLLLRMSMLAEPATPASPPTEPPMATSVMSSAWAALTTTPSPPQARMSSPWPMNASTVPLRTRIAAETPTPADPPTFTLPVNSWILFGPGATSLTVSVALTWTEPSEWRTVLVPAPPSMYARVPVAPSVLRTTTMIEPTTAASVDAPASTAISSSCSVAMAPTSTLPPAKTAADLPMKARVSFWM